MPEEIILRLGLKIDRVITDYRKFQSDICDVTSHPRLDLTGNSHLRALRALIMSAEVETAVISYVEIIFIVQCADEIQVLHLVRFIAAISRWGCPNGIRCPA